MQKPLRPIELIVLQGTSLCNLNCTYCDLSVESRKTQSVMPFDLIETAFRDIFSSGLCAPRVNIIWHSGEPLTQSPEYYDTAIEQILRCRDTYDTKGVDVQFDIQTNGVSINETWQAFFVRHKQYLTVGISCDGPAEMHDAFRVNWSGRSTHHKTIEGMQRLADVGIDFKVIAVVTEAALKDPDGFFDFFWSWRHALRGFHFNILASGDAVNNPALQYSTEDRARYAGFYRHLLELLKFHKAAEQGFAIENFSQTLGRLLHPPARGEASQGEESSAPLKSLTLDASGNVTTFYAGLAVDAFPDQFGDGQGFSLGNMRDTSLEAMVTGSKLRQMIGAFTTSQAACADGCSYFEACSGGFELTKLERFGRFDATETPECVIHVKALVDVLLADLADEKEKGQPSLVARAGH